MFLKKFTPPVNDPTQELAQDQLSAWGLKDMSEMQEFISGPRFKTALLEMKRGGRSIKESLSISNLGVNSLYRKATHLYRLGLFEKAAYFFRVLSLIDYKENKYLLALNACYRKLDKKVEALMGYYLVFCRDNKNIIALINLAEIGYELECDDDVKNTLNELDKLVLTDEVRSRVERLRAVMN
ncbi:MAG: hypothetical protein V4629_07270 [Pseudomonadota bacterium]